MSCMKEKNLKISEKRDLTSIENKKGKAIENGEFMKCT